MTNKQVFYNSRPKRRWFYLLNITLAVLIVLNSCSGPTPIPTPAPATPPPPTDMPPAVDTPTPAVTPTPSPVVQTLRTNYEYDPNGNLSTRTDPNGAPIRYEYDTENRLTRILYPDGSQVAYVYDELGRRTQMTDPLGATTYEYDLHGRMTAVTDANGNRVGYEYDPADRLTALIYPDESVVHYGYDEQGRLAQVQDASGVTAYAYDQAGQLAGRTLPNGVTTAYAYDYDGRLTAIHHTNAAGQTLLAFEYTLDANGNCTQMVRTTETGEQQVTDYEYDDLERLVNVTYPGGRFEQYTYDAAGNRLTMTTAEGETAYAYDQANHLLSLTEPDGSVTTFNYDANGNLIERQSPRGTVRYTFDYENQLVRVEDGTAVVEFVYDGGGNRVTKIVDGVQTEYVNHVNSPLPHVLIEQSANRELRYVGGDHLLAQTNVTTGEAFYLLEDRLGSTAALTNRDGALAETFHYDVFGAASPTGGVQSPYGFTGERYDPETKLLYLHARYYHPDIGRFISTDPFPGSLTNPQNQNGFAYVGNNPTNFADPSGLRRSCPIYPAWDEYVMDCYPWQEWTTPQSMMPYNPSQFIHPYDLIPPYTNPGCTMTGQQSGIGCSPYLPYSEPDKPFVETIPDMLIIGEGHSPSPRDMAIWGGKLVLGQIIGKVRDHLVRSSIPLPGARLVTACFVIMDAFNFIKDIPSVTLPYVLFFPPYMRMPVTGRIQVPVVRQVWVWRCIGDHCWREKIVVVSGTSIAYNGGGDDDFFYYAQTIFYPPFPPCPPFCDGYGGGVGGVLLEGAAEVLVDLNDITGVAYDPATGQLILLGRQDRSLPPMSLDDLAVAIRAAYEPVGEKDGALLFESPGVSIDPLDPWRPDVHHPEMAVTYLGHTEGTAFGQVLFEADRYLKVLGHGEDNLTDQPVEPGVPGYQSMLELWQTYPQNPACPRWHRKWFFINQVRLKETADGRAMVFDESINPIRLEARFVRWVNGEKVNVDCSDPAVEAFVGHVNEHYGEYAQAEPSLLKLQQLARVAAVVQWIQENEIPLDTTWLGRYQIQAVDTPTRTRAITTTLDVDGGQRSLYGGVDFDLEKDVNLFVEPDDGRAARLSQAVLAARPDDVTLAWEVEVEGEPYRAVALTLAPIPIEGGYSIRQTDLTAPAASGQSLALTRSYNSLDPLPGPLGHGWLPAPFALYDRRSLQGGDTGGGYDIYAQLVSADGVRVTFDVKELWEPDPAVGLVSPPTTGGRGYLGIAYEVQDGQPRYRVWRQDRSQLLFDAGGRLVALVDRDGNQISYRYDAKGRLGAIVGPGEQGSIHLEYDAQGHVGRAVASTGREAAYRYDDAADLVEATLPGGRTLTYSYDATHRLTSVSLNGVTVLQNRYDELGRLVEQVDGDGYSTTAAYDRRSGQAIWAGPAGGSFHQTSDADGPPLTSTDPLGHTTTYAYNDRGNLASVTDPRGNTTYLEYDERNRPIAWINALGQQYKVLRGFMDQDGNEYALAPDGTAVSFTYDAQRRLMAIEEGYTQFEHTAEGISTVSDPALVRQTAFQYDSAGRLAGYQRFGLDQSGEEITVGPAVEFSYDDLGKVTAIQVGGQLAQQREYDALGRLTGISDPLGHQLDLTYDDAHRLTAVTGATGLVRYTYDDLGRVAQVVGPMGQTTGYEYDGRGNLTQVAEANGAVTCYEYDGRGNLILVVNANGHEIHYVYDEMNRLSQVVEEGALGY